MSNVVRQNSVRLKMDNKECSSCKSSNPVSASYCRKCGTRFPEQTKPGKSHMCHIENFAVKKQSNGKFLVEWNAINADKVTINGRDVTGQSRFIVPVKGSQTILLRADNTTSFDVKEANVVYDSQIIYKDRIVERKVASAANTVTIFFLIVFIIISVFSLHYAYQLEDRNYSGERFLSNIFGYKPYLLVNGSSEVRKVNVPAQGASLVCDVKTNASEYEVLDLPDWCTLEKSDSHFIIKATKNRQGDRTADIRIRTMDDEVTMCLEQAIYKPQRLLVNDKKIVESNFSASSGQITYQVNTDADSYEIASLPSWTKVIAQGTESFTISYEKNPKRTERTDWFKVKSEGMEVKINLIQAAQKITGQIENVTVEHNVYEDGIKGMKIHLKFLVQQMKGIQGRCVAYMYYENGTPLKDTNGSYRTTDGQCSFGKDFTPIYDSSTFNDFEIFVPLNELEVEKGKHNMKFFCTVWEKSTNSSTPIARSDYYSFTLTKN